MPQHTAATAQVISQAPAASKPQGSICNRKVQTWTEYELSEIKKKLIAARVARRLIGETFNVYGNPTTIDSKGVARDKEGNTIWEFEPGEYEGKTTAEIKDKLEVIFFYDRSEGKF